MRVSFAGLDLTRTGSLVALVGDGGVLSASAEKLNERTNGAVRRAMKASRFKGAVNKTLAILSPAGISAERILLVGVGKAADFDALAAQNLGGTVAAALAGAGDDKAAIAIDPVKGSSLSAAEFAANAAYGALLRSYRFDKYRTREKAEDKPTLKSLVAMTRDHAAARRLYGPMAKVADGVFLTRDLVSEPANVLYPASFAARTRVLAKLGVKVQVLDRKHMESLGMGALLGVAQGSSHEARIVALRWDGAPRTRDKRPIAFVGKGVTFDSGGISIKPSANMEDMKWDMGGAGVVTGLMHALAARKAKVNAVGVIGLVENMPSATAQRPGDVVKTMSGQTIEVINTDAEGRLVLADALWWCQTRFKPHTVVDLATLTGAIIISLGHHHAGLFANNDELAERLTAAGKATGESVWRMPLDAAYDEQVRSQIADIKNVGGRDGGSITAAKILQRFIKEDVAWAHLDIAGVTWSSGDKPTVPKGGTAFGVRLLDRLVADNYES